MDIEILEVTNFPKELLNQQVIRDKETQETYINKNLFGKYVNEYIQEKGLKYNEQNMIDFAEYVASYSDKNKNIHNQMLHAKSKYDGAERTIDLLKIWLKESKTK
jgi:hypothetical protein